jgi:serine/threonine protein kinase
MAHPEKLDAGGNPLLDRMAADEVPARHEPSTGDCSEFEPGLATLLEAVTRRIEVGEAVDAEQLAMEYPAWANSIRGLVPTIQGLARAGKGSGGEASGQPPGNADAKVGRTFGNFRIVREVGRGGMGIVYEALQEPLDRPVALKVLSLAAAMDPRALQRFQLEAQVAGLLQHPRIVPVHAVGQVDDIPFYAMQLIEGISLAGLIADLRRLIDGSSRPVADGGSGAVAAGFLAGRFAVIGHESGSSHHRALDIADLPPGNESTRSIGSSHYIRTVVRLGIQAAEALGYAHDQGIVHRDIKPANLLLDRRGDLWITDFGMADVQGDAGLTMTGDLPGTLRYMSPEQARGRRDLVDRRTDVYSLGATLYELLTLQPAIAASDRAQIFRVIAEEEPIAIRGLNPAVPIDLATIIAKAMAKEPQARYETAWELAEDLKRYTQGLPIAARPVGPLERGWRWCRRQPLLAGMAASLVVALAGGFAGVTWNWREAVRQKQLVTIERDSKETQRALAEAAGKDARDQAAHAAAAEKKALLQAAKAKAINDFLTGKLLDQADPAHNPITKQVTMLEVLDRASAEVGRSFATQPELEAAIRLAICRIYHGLLEYAKAEGHARAAYMILRDRRGDFDSERLQAMIDTGHMLRHLNRDDEAEPLIRQAVDETPRILGPRHELSFDAESNLGNLFENQKKFAEAEKVYRHIVQESGLALGPKDHYRLVALGSLANVLMREHKHEEADHVLREAIALDREALGPRHPTTLNTLDLLARHLVHQGRQAEAAAIYQPALDAMREVYGPDHPATLRAMGTMGSLLQSRGQLAEAEPLLRGCVEGQRRTLGATHADTVEMARRLDALMKDRARTSSAVVGTK